MGRLLTVTKDGNLVEEYVYDSAGTRTYEMNSLRGISGRTFTYDDEDHLLTVGDASYQYDLDGYLTTQTTGTQAPYKVTSYSYSSRGELLSVTLPDGTDIEYVHDPLGRRIAKKVNGTITEKYLWQGLTRLLAVYDGNDLLLARFLYADGRMPVAMEKGGTTYYFTYDQVGSLRAVADSSGNVVKRIDYDSFENIINDTNASFEIPFGFAGGLHDRDTGLVRFGFRDYDPDVGRWTAKDPILFADGDTDLYGYCLNVPINLVDPLGLDPLVIFTPKKSFVGKPTGWRGLLPGMGPAGHHMRNTIGKQKCPEKEPKMGDKQGCGTNDWHYDGRSLAHGKYKTYRGRGPYRGWQCVYDDDGNLVTEPLLMGTYDYVPPDVSYMGHFWDDFFPWILFGN